MMRRLFLDYRRTYLSIHESLLASTIASFGARPAAGRAVIGAKEQNAEFQDGIWPWLRI